MVSLFGVFVMEQKGCWTSVKESLPSDQQYWGKLQMPNVLERIIGGNVSSLEIKKPHVRDLSSRYALFDLHLHSSFSDGVPTPTEIVSRAAARGIGVAITDHNAIGGSIRAWELDRCPVLPGIEVASRQGLDVLAYFESPAILEEYYKKCVEGRVRTADPSSFTDIDVYALMQQAKEHGAFVVLPHPFAPGWKNWASRLRKSAINIAENVDGIECFNAALSKRRNIRALELSENWRKVVTGGSDAHTLETLGDCLTLMPLRFRSTPFQALQNGATRVVGKRSIHYKRHYGHARMALNHMRYWPLEVRQRIRRRF